MEKVSEDLVPTCRLMMWGHSGNFDVVEGGEKNIFTCLSWTVTCECVTEHTQVKGFSPLFNVIRYKFMFIQRLEWKLVKRDEENEKQFSDNLSTSFWLVFLLFSIRNMENCLFFIDQKKDNNWEFFKDNESENKRGVRWKGDKDQLVDKKNNFLILFFLSPSSHLKIVVASAIANAFFLGQGVSTYVTRH